MLLGPSQAVFPLPYVPEGLEIHARGHVFYGLYGGSEVEALAGAEAPGGTGRKGLRKSAGIGA